MAVGDYRVSKLRDYLFDVINALTTDNDYQITYRIMLKNREIKSYSQLVKIINNDGLILMRC